MIRTASGKEQALVDFYAQLAREGTNVTDLARRARVGRTALTLLFNGRRNGQRTWRLVLPLLSPAALFHLKQCSAWNAFASEEVALLAK